jgi:hypothetical protein
LISIVAASSARHAHRDEIASAAARLDRTRSRLNSTSAALSALPWKVTGTQMEDPGQVVRFSQRRRARQTACLDRAISPSNAGGIYRHRLSKCGSDRRRRLGDARALSTGRRRRPRPREDEYAGAASDR